MYFKVAAKNVRRSYRDYILYFLTLALGVCVFYVFNSIEAQDAMLKISQSTHAVMQSMTRLMGVLSIFVSIILGFLIVSADQFLIKRRKKEFGIYMTLGMDKGKVARILIAETFLTGVISLAAGLALGIFTSQWLSILTAKMFEVDMTGYVFIFSPPAFLKTILYFSLIYVVVILFSAVSVSRYRLIDLINADKKNEKPQVKSAAATVVLFVLSLACIVTAYVLVIRNGIIDFDMRLVLEIILGGAGTFLFFASLSGFFFRIIKKNKKRYYKGLNMFVLRQVDSRINSTYRSFAVICLLLFFTITIFSFGFGMNAAIEQSMINMMPYDVVAYSDQDIPLADTLYARGVDINRYADDYAEHAVYEKDGLTNGSVLGQVKLKGTTINVNMESPVSVMRVSDYNREMRMQAKNGIDLKEGQAAFQSNSVANVTDALGTFIKEGKTVQLDGTDLSVYPQVLTDALTVSAGDSVFTLIVPDDVAANCSFAYRMLYFNCKGDSGEMQERLAQHMQGLAESEETGAVIQMTGAMVLRDAGGFSVSVLTKDEVREMHAGMKAIISYIGIYLGIIFLITSAAILALQQLSEMADNRRRYAVLRKIGTDEKMTSRAILKQTSIYFLLPLALACVHSVV